MQMISIFMTDLLSLYKSLGLKFIFRLFLSYFELNFENFGLTVVTKFLINFEP